MAAYGQTQYSPALQPPGPYTPYPHHTQGYSMPSYSESQQAVTSAECSDAFYKSVSKISERGTKRVVVVAGRKERDRVSVGALHFSLQICHLLSEALCSDASACTCAAARKRVIKPVGRRGPNKNNQD